MALSPAVTAPADYRAAKEALAYRVRPAAVLDIGGKEGLLFLQGQLTQDVRGLSPGDARPTAALTPKGKLLFLARLVGLVGEGRRLVLAASEHERALAQLKKFVIFQKVDIADRSPEFVRVSLYGPRAADAARSFVNATALPGEGEFGAEILAERSEAQGIEERLRSYGAGKVGPESAEVLRVEAGRPRFGQDADASNLIDEVGLDAAISTTKGCYVGQEVVARMRTYGRVNRRLVGFRFPDGPIGKGSILRLPEEAEPGKVEQGRVTSAVLSPTFGPIGLGYAFREVPAGGRLVFASGPPLGAIVTGLPFAE
ncbi:MAG TPA: hypothetical protein VKG01_07890 [Thermoanaerobaculia bacterium]|nr:hypothetical protein [Thermoanaerobaculia bacterium]